MYVWLRAPCCSHISEWCGHKRIDARHQDTKCYAVAAVLYIHGHNVGELRYQVCVSLKKEIFFCLFRLRNFKCFAGVYPTATLVQAHVCPTAFPNAAMEEWFPTENALRVPLLHHSLSAFFLVPSYLVLIQGILCIA